MKNYIIDTGRFCFLSQGASANDVLTYYIKLTCAIKSDRMRYEDWLISLVGRELCVATYLDECEVRCYLADKIITVHKDLLEPPNPYLFDPPIEIEDSKNII